MDSQGSMGSSTSNVEGGLHFCSCGLPSKLKTSWTERNPGRRFFGCGRYGSLGNCNFFAWYDPPTTQRSEKIINGLLKKNQELSDVIEPQKIEILVLNQKVETQRAELEAIGGKWKHTKVK